MVLSLETCFQWFCLSHQNTGSKWVPRLVLRAGGCWCGVREGWLLVKNRPAPAYSACQLCYCFHCVCSPAPCHHCILAPSLPPSCTHRPTLPLPPPRPCHAAVLTVFPLHRRLNCIPAQPLLPLYLRPTSSSIVYLLSRCLHQIPAPPLSPLGQTHPTPGTVTFVSDSSPHVCLL